jgi:hypothetical protein
VPADGFDVPLAIMAIPGLGSAPSTNRLAIMAIPGLVNAPSINLTGVRSWHTLPLRQVLFSLSHWLIIIWFYYILALFITEPCHRPVPHILKQPLLLLL